MSKELKISPADEAEILGSHIIAISDRNEAEQELARLGELLFEGMITEDEAFAAFNRNQQQY